MKRIGTLILAIIMLAAMSVPVFADESFDGVDDSVNVEVNGIVQYTGSSEVQLISVDVAWEEMYFTYVEGVHYGWNAETHEYAGGYDGYWENSEADITVTNHSNVGVTASLSFQSNVETVTGAFAERSGTENDGILELESAEDTEVDEAPAATATFSVEGSISESAEMMGEITVLIESVEPQPRIHMVGFSTSSSVEAEFDRSGKVAYTIYYMLRPSLPAKPTVLLVGENIKYATGETYQLALLDALGNVKTSLAVNTTNFSYDIENDIWTTKNWSLPTTAGQYKLVYSNDGGNTWISTGATVNLVALTA